MKQSYYKNRSDKPEWITKKFSPVFASAKKILDVGCDKKQLKNFLSKDKEYVGVDMNPAADLIFNLDSGKPLSFGDNSFDLVVSFDVLEHIENIHFIFDEICRVSSGSVLISLPNNLQSAIKGYILGRKSSKDKESQLKYGLYAKFYGLPFERPEDRHRWFFNAEEAINFVDYRSKKNGFELISVFYEVDAQPLWKRMIKVIFSGFSRRRMLNFFSGTIFFELKNK